MCALVVAYTISAKGRIRMTKKKVAPKESPPRDEAQETPKVYKHWTHGLLSEEQELDLPEQAEAKPKAPKKSPKRKKRAKPAEEKEWPEGEYFRDAEGFHYLGRWEGSHFRDAFGFLWKDGGQNEWPLDPNKLVLEDDESMLSQFERLAFTFDSDEVRDWIKKNFYGDEEFMSYSTGLSALRPSEPPTKDEQGLILLQGATIPDALTRSQMLVLGMEAYGLAAHKGEDWVRENAQHVVDWYARLWTT